MPVKFFQLTCMSLPPRSRKLARASPSGHEHGNFSKLLDWRRIWRMYYLRERSATQKEKVRACVHRLPTLTDGSSPSGLAFSFRKSDQEHGFTFHQLYMQGMSMASYSMKILDRFFRWLYLLSSTRRPENSSQPSAFLLPNSSQPPTCSVYRSFRRSVTHIPKWRKNNLRPCYWRWWDSFCHSELSFRFPVQESQLVLPLSWPEPCQGWGFLYGYGRL